MWEQTAAYSATHQETSVFIWSDVSVHQIFTDLSFSDTEQNTNMLFYTFLQQNTGIMDGLDQYIDSPP